MDEKELRETILYWEKYIDEIHDIINDLKWSIKFFKEKRYDEL